MSPVKPRKRAARAIRTWKQIRREHEIGARKIEEVQGAEGAIEWLLDTLATVESLCEKMDYERRNWKTLGAGA